MIPGLYHGPCQIIARVLGVELKIEEIPVAAHLAAHPDEAPSCANRYYDQSRLRAVGGKVPATPLEVGLREQVESMF